MQGISQHLIEKWKPVLDHEALPAISDSYRRSVTAMLLENQEKAISEQKLAENSIGLLTEAAPTNSAGTGGFATAGGSGVAGYDPILISLVRRAAPQMIAYDICGVQPMSGPSGLIFYMKSSYVGDQATDGTMAKISDPEALFGESQTAFSASEEQDEVAGIDTAATNAASTDPFAADYYGASQDTVTGMNTSKAEALGGATVNNFREMGFTIDKETVTAVTRALKAEYSTELAQDLKAVHGLDAETELSNILSTEILSEINREVIRTVIGSAKYGAQTGTTTEGTFDLDTDSNGRWSVEKFKGLHFSLDRDANAIAVDTRRGRGNIIICSADVASALSMTGTLDTGGGGGQGGLSADGVTGNTFVGTLNGKYKVYVDPYFNAAHEFYTVGYKGSSPFDAGIFYCPYVPLQMVKATGEQTFQPKIGFKTRYGLTANPFTTLTEPSSVANATNGNAYYRKVKVSNLM
tara:strand:+ start:11447 stop:12844 length:1398 start_codon:yes stop_codon:yes gene_type:complete